MAARVNRPTDLKVKEADVNRKLQFYGIISAFQQGKAPSVRSAPNCLGRLRALTNLAIERSNRCCPEQFPRISRPLQAFWQTVDRGQGFGGRCSRSGGAGEEASPDQESRQFAAGFYLADTAIRPQGRQHSRCSCRQEHGQTARRQGSPRAAHLGNLDYHQWPVPQAS